MKKRQWGWRGHLQLGALPVTSLFLPELRCPLPPRVVPSLPARPTMGTDLHPATLSRAPLSPYSWAMQPGLQAEAAGEEPPEGHLETSPPLSPEHWPSLQGSQAPASAPPRPPNPVWPPTGDPWRGHPPLRPGSQGRARTEGAADGIVSGLRAAGVLASVCTGDWARQPGIPGAGMGTARARVKDSSYGSAGHQHVPHPEGPSESPWREFTREPHPPGPPSAWRPLRP